MATKKNDNQPNDAFRRPNEKEIAAYQKRQSLYGAVCRTAEEARKARFAYLDALIEELKLPKWDQGRNSHKVDDVVLQLGITCRNYFSRPSLITKKEILEFVGDRYHIIF